MTTITIEIRNQTEEKMIERVGGYQQVTDKAQQHAGSDYPKQYRIGCQLPLLPVAFKDLRKQGFAVVNIQINLHDIPRDEWEDANAMIMVMLEYKKNTVVGHGRRNRRPS